MVVPRFRETRAVAEWYFGDSSRKPALCDEHGAVRFSN
jgi:hypothetical protein